MHITKMMMKPCPESVNGNMDSWDISLKMKEDEEKEA